MKEGRKSQFVFFILCAFAVSLSMPASAQENQLLSADHLLGELIGYGVVNHQNEELGNLDDIMLDLQGTVQYAVISYGGFLGVGDNLVAIPWRAIQIDQENRKVVINVTKDQLEKAPRFNPRTLPDMNDSQWREQNQKFFQEQIDAAETVISEEKITQTQRTPGQQTSQVQRQTQVQGDSGAIQVQYSGQDQVRVGENYEYIINLQNVSSQPLKNIQIREEVPESFQISQAQVREQGEQQNQQPRADSSQNQQEQQLSPNANQATQEQLQQPPQTQLQGQQQQTQQQRPSVDQQFQNQPQQNQQQQTQQQNQQSQGNTSWTIEQLQPGESKAIHISGIPQQEGPIETCTFVSYEQPEVCKTFEAVKPNLELVREILNQKGEVVNEVFACEPIMFRYRLTNTGTGTTEPAQITEELPEGLQAEPGGQQVQIKAGPIAAGETFEQVVNVTLQPEVSYEGRAMANTEKLQAESEVAQLRVLKPSLAMDVQSPDAVKLNDEVQYKVTIQNTSNAPAQNTVLQFQRPQNVEQFMVYMDKGGQQTQQTRQSQPFVAQGVQSGTQAQQQDQQAIAQDIQSGTQPPQQEQQSIAQNIQAGTQAQQQGVLSADRMEQIRQQQSEQPQGQQPGLQNVHLSGDSIEIGQLGPNESKELVITFIPTETGQLNSSFVANAYCAEAVNSEIAMTVEGVPALRLEMVDLTDPVRTGENTVYEIKVQNQGSREDLNIQLKGTLPQEMQFVEGQGDSEVQADGQTLNFGRIEQLAPGQIATWHVTVKAQQEGNVRMQLELSSEANQQAIIEMEPTNIQ